MSWTHDERCLLDVVPCDLRNHGLQEAVGRCEPSETGSFATIFCELTLYILIGRWIQRSAAVLGERALLGW
jgi:hypothetical protein